MENINGNDVYSFEMYLKEPEEKITQLITSRITNPDYKKKLDHNSILKLKSKWGELSSAADEDDTSNLKLKLKTDYEREVEDKRYECKFHMADMSLMYIAKAYKDSMLPIEQIRRDQRKIVFTHDSGQRLKVDLQVENSYSIIIWPELGEYCNEG